MIKDLIYKYKNSIMNSSWLLIEYGLRILVGIFITAWMARYLGPDKFGIYSYIIALVSILNIIVLCGLDNVVVRNISRDIHSENCVISIALIIRLVLGIIVYSGMLLYVKVWEISDASYYLIASLTVLLQFSLTYDLWFQSKLKSKTVVKVKVFSLVFANVIKFYLIKEEFSLIYFFVINILELLTTALLLTFQYYKYNTKWKFELEIGAFRAIIVDSFPFLISALSVLIYMRIDQILIKNYLGEYDLGLYSAAIPLSTFVTTIPVLLNISLMPYCAKLKQSSETEYNKFIENVFCLYFWLTAIISLPIIIFSDFIIDVLYGSAFSTSSTVLKFHIWGSVIASLGVAQSLWLVNENKGYYALYRTLMGAVISIFLNLIFIEKYGVLTCAYVFIISQMISVVISNSFRFRAIFFMQLKAIFLWKQICYLLSRLYR